VFGARWLNVRERSTSHVPEIPHISYEWASVRDRPTVLITHYLIGGAEGEDKKS